jgi:hypothetical protein
MSSAFAYFKLHGGGAARVRKAAVIAVEPAASPDEAYVYFGPSESERWLVEGDALAVLAKIEAA